MLKCKKFCALCNATNVDQETKREIIRLWCNSQFQYKSGSKNMKTSRPHWRKIAG